MKRNKSKKLITLLLCGCLMFGLSHTAFAYTDESSTETEAAADPVIDRSDSTSTQETDAKPFTADGNATLQDEADSSQNKLFYTVTTKNNNTFFLVIDKDRTSDNVYMLSMIEEADLQDFIEEEEAAKEESILVSDAPDTSAPETTETIKTPESANSPKETENPSSEEAKSNHPLGYILLILLAIGAVGAYYVLKIRPKKELEDEEDETAYGGEEQPDDADDTTADETEAAKADEAEPSDTEESMEDDNVPFQDYPDPDDFPDEKQ